MHTASLTWTATTGWSSSAENVPEDVDVVLYFAAPGMTPDDPSSPLADLRRRHAGALMLGCTTAGEIDGTTVRDDSVTALLLGFAHTRVRGACVRVSSVAESAAAGERIGRELYEADLRHVFVLSDGLAINGSALAAALRESLPSDVCITGGLAGDGPRFQYTSVGLDDEFGPGRAAAIGFYGDRLRMAWGSAGGWQAFGPKRLVTRAKGNVLYTLDQQPALALYKRYLGELASDLPGSGLLFPLQLLPDSATQGGLVRTILAVDEQAQSLTFAGDVPVGRSVRFMKAGPDALVDGAAAAAELASVLTTPGPRAAVLISCVGRRLVLGQAVEEEVEAVLARLGGNVVAAGFYSYGEICPEGTVTRCELHNQTMTLTVFAEA